MKEQLGNSVPLVVNDEPFRLPIVVGILKDLKCETILEAPPEDGT